jgi:hypothetical protein
MHEPKPSLRGVSGRPGWVLVDQTDPDFSVRGDLALVWSTRQKSGRPGRNLVDQAEIWSTRQYQDRILALVSALFWSTRKKSGRPELC